MTKRVPPKSGRAPRRLEFLPNEGGDRLELLGDGSQRLQFLDSTLGYAMETRGVPSHVSFEEGLVSLYLGRSAYHLTIAGEAARRLFHHIGWGSSTEDNRVEQGGLLLGRVYEDRERDLVYGVVEDVVPARLARGSASHLLFSAFAWKEMLDYVDRLNESTRPQVIGWYHTHPGNLDVFMSGTDQDTQRRLFSEPWHFSVVLNPQRRKFRVYHGAESKECSGNIVERGETLLTDAGLSVPESRPKGERGNSEEPKAEGYRRWPPRLFNNFKFRTAFAFVGGFLMATVLAAFILPRSRFWPSVTRGEESHPLRERGSGSPSHDAERMLQVAVETSLMQGSDPLSAREILRLHPGAALELVDGPNDGWYLVRIPTIGWVRQSDVSELGAGGRTPEPSLSGSATNFP